MMRCLSPAEVEVIFGSLGFSVSLENAWYRSDLRLDSSFASHQVRIAAVQPAELLQITHFVGALNRWLPSNQERLFWVGHWETILGFEDAIAQAARIGIGETRSLSDAPGYYFDKYDWHQQDPSEIPSGHREALGMLVGLISMLMLSQSDGWLISTNSRDRIEFWEGNFFFHSEDKEQLRRAEAIIHEFDCVRWKSARQVDFPGSGTV
jgi:hypothetical protein